MSVLKIKQLDGKWKPIQMFKGEKGEKGDKGEKGEKGDSYVLTEQDKEDIANMVNAPVTDVQIDGTSVVNNGVANIVSTVKELREYTWLGEDTDLIVIPLPEKYEKIWFRFRCRINNSENTLPDRGTAEILAWLGDNSTFKENGDTSITETAQITTSNVFLIRGWYIFDFPYLDRFSVGGSKTDTNYASFNVKQHGSRVNVKKFTSYPKFLYIRPLATDAGYLFKANSSLAVYAK